MARKQLSFTPTIAKPCQESWAAMDGGLRERYCELCDKKVHNFAAMTPAEIERLVRTRAGQLCARITTRSDGSLVMLASQVEASSVAKWVASASLVVGAAGLAAQGTVDSQETLVSMQAINGDAILTGHVAAGAVVTALSAGQFAADARPDENGVIRLTVRPGTYDVEVRQGTLTASMRGVTLLEGEQVMPELPMPTTVEVQALAQGESFATMGTLESVVTTRFTLFSILRHPIRYVKYLRHRS